MGIRFRKYLTIIPGVKINLSKSGFSTTIGPKGASVNLGKDGVYINAGIPGTGIFMREKLSGRSHDNSAQTTDTLRELASEFNEIDEKILRVWENTPHPMKYPKFNRGRYYRDKPENSYDKSPFVILLIVAIVTLFLSQYLRSLFFPILIMSAIFGMAFILYRRHTHEYNVKLTQWQNDKDEWEREQDNLEEDFVAIIDCGKEEPEEALSVAFENIRWPYDTNISYQVDGDVAYVDIDLPEIEELPSEFCGVSGRGRNKELVSKAKSQIKSREDYAIHVHGIGMLVCGTVLSTLLHVNTVFISAYTQRLDKKTMFLADEYLYSVKITRSQWAASINFDKLEYVNPILELNKFEIIRSMTTSYIFKPIVPFKQGCITKKICTIASLNA